MYGLLPRRFEKRKVFILRLWARGKDEPVRISKVQDISTGETIYVYSMEVLFDWLE